MTSKKKEKCAGRLTGEACTGYLQHVDQNGGGG